MLEIAEEKKKIKIPKILISKEYMSDTITDIDSVPKIDGETKELYEERLQKERKERKKKLAAKISESGISFSKDPWERLVPPWRSAKVSARSFFCRRIDELIIIY